MPANEPFDVVVVGGGHNGLVAAGLLAKAGARVTLLERRPIVGGAAVSEQPWGLDFTVTALSYVVGLMPTPLRRELDLERHGYRVYPQGPYFAPRADGTALRLPDDPARRHAEVARFSARDADALERWDEWLCRLAGFLSPLLSEVPPRFGSRAPADVAAQLRFVWGRRGLSVRDIGDITRLLTSSVADLLDDFFESDALRGVLSVSGVIGTWAGPRSPGTAYVMAHHKITDVGDGELGTWGFPEGGMGGLSRALANAARSFGAEIRTGTPVARIDVRNGRAVGVTLEAGEELRADVVIAATHPQTAFLALLDTDELPPSFVDDLQRWKTRSGTVKINLAIDRLPRFTAHPEPDPEVHGGTIVLAPSLDHVEQAFQDAAAGRPAARPFADVCIPSVFDRTLCPEGTHVVSMFTQWVPHTWAAEPHRDELDVYADSAVAAMEEVAPGFADSILHRQVIGPHDMEHEYGLLGGNIFHGELSLGQLFHMRPAPGYADTRTPIRALYYCGSATHGGGGVTGIPGLAVVRRIERDRGALGRRRRP